VLMPGSEVPTAECNGLEVRMPVKSQDFRAFQERARDVLSRFKPLPKFTGVPNFTVEPVTYVIEGQGWGLHEGRNRAKALQGGVVYPIDPAAMDGLDETERMVLELSIDITFKIGELEVAPSREALSYNKRTVANIRKRIAEVLVDLPKTFESRFASCKTEWEAKCLYNKTIHNGNWHLNRLAQNGKFPIKWRNQNLTNNEFDLDRVGLEDVEVFVFRNDRGFKRGKKMEWDVSRTFNALTNTYVTAGERKTIHATVQTRFVIQDTRKFARIRVQHWMDTSRQQNSGYYNQSRNEDKVVDHVYMLAGDPVQIKALLKKLGSPESINVSTLDVPARVKATGTTRTINAYKWRGRSYRKSDSWEAQDFEIEDGGYYVELHGCSPVYNGEQIVDFHKVLDEAKNLNLLKTGYELVGLRPSTVKMVLADKKHAKKWTNIIDFIKQEVQQRLTTGHAQAAVNSQALVAFRDSNNYFGSSWREATSLASLVGKTSATGVFGKFVEGYEAMRKQSTNNTKALEALAGELKLELKNKNGSNLKPSYNLKGLWEAALETYPMLRFLKSNYEEPWKNAKDVTAVIEYVNTLDSLKKA
jgi:hypothetical protein